MLQFINYFEISNGVVDEFLFERLLILLKFTQKQVENLQILCKFKIAFGQIGRNYLVHFSQKHISNNMELLGIRSNLRIESLVKLY